MGIIYDTKSLDSKGLKIGDMLSALRHLESKHCDKQRSIYSKIWKSVKNKTNRQMLLTQEFINTKHILNDDLHRNYYYASIWIIEFTKQRSLTKNIFLGLE